MTLATGTPNHPGMAAAAARVCVLAGRGWVGAGLQRRAAPAFGWCGRGPKDAAAAAAGNPGRASAAAAKLRALIDFLTPLAALRRRAPLSLGGGDGGGGGGGWGGGAGAPSSPQTQDGNASLDTTQRAPPEEKACT